MKEKHGSLIGGMLLVCGSAVGAGMLGMPILAGLAGFFPTLLIAILTWAFMTISALLLVEVNGWFVHKVNMITMAGHTLGKVGKIFSWVLYLFLSYALLVAYIAGSDNALSGLVTIPKWIYYALFTLVFGWVVYRGTRTVDHWNRYLVLAMCIAYLGLIFMGIAYVDTQLLLHRVPSYVLIALPIFVASFGFHNIIPSLTAYMKGDLKRVRLTIIVGGLLALVIYLVWAVIVMGIVPYGGSGGILQSYNEGVEGTEALINSVHSGDIGIWARVFSFFAILSSFLAQALALVHFLSDGFRIKHERNEHLGMCLLALVPPLFFASLNPQIFLNALSFGGSLAAVLFGLLPALMVWVGRYRQNNASGYRVLGGKCLLLVIMLCALFIFITEMAYMLDTPFLPSP